MMNNTESMVYYKEILLEKDHFIRQWADYVPETEVSSTLIIFIFKEFTLILG